MEDMPRLPDDKNYMGSFMCEVMIYQSRINLCLCNPGMIRIDWRKGQLNYDLIF